MGGFLCIMLEPETREVSLPYLPFSQAPTAQLHERSVHPVRRCAGSRYLQTVCIDAASLC